MAANKKQVADTAPEEIAEEAPPIQEQPAVPEVPAVVEVVDVDTMTIDRFARESGGNSHLIFAFASCERLSNPNTSRKLTLDDWQAAFAEWSKVSRG